ncbi:CDP-glycerol:poly(Glycerophosphate) glycerophosphotransferase [Microbacterium sp. 8M]|uniref:CDP-glycerol glycerophosphotransferase family protein n=1 Tax=Microbacterium sp. 8M TaxID=2653153 RepID=UPI0012F24282|nr:CDP-glycerol glycerophosphotransferase family protein [Microbacterium sp. 8M]VXC05585.1 CDP-glycerol:poly(Glycerophosphate) glycerophosphotransferase [Microbacterium sp. 8M]
MTSRVTTVRVDEEQQALLIEGNGSTPGEVELSGRRAVAAASEVVAGEDGPWRAVLPLHASRWGGADLPLPSGDYALVLDGRTAAVPVVATVVLPGLRVGSAGGEVRIDPPIDPAYETAEGRLALEGRYAALPGAHENAVFFESFYGQSTGCNPGAIDRELAARAPGVTRYWSVVDLSVAVPDGAVPVVEGSPEWWRARADARLLIVNDWLRRRFDRKPGQRVLQTWHGTPLKRLALHRPGLHPRRWLAVVRESRRWDVLLAQNPYAERVLRKAYAFLRRPVWVEGYPRNDVLTTGDATRIRAALGIDPDARVLLYAPTWRDDRSEIVDFVDPRSLAEAADAVVLVRGHSRTIRPGRDQAGSRVIDVTGYPDTAELLLAADALVTDYSSVMFDFSATGKPMYFLVPDLEHYRGKLRGFYFDLAARAPGPLVRTQEELVAALADVSALAEHAPKYVAWQAQFNGRDDGSASARVVDRILDLGWLDA